MIIKPLEIPIILLQTEALKMRLASMHLQKEKVSANARKLRAGYNGERSLEFPLSFLPYDKYLIFYNVRLQDPNGFFQIDTLLVSANFILIIEVKNIKNHVIFDDMGQVIRIENEKEQAFTNPIDQINLQHLRLLRWLRRFNLPSIPLEKIVVYSNSNTILKNLTNNKEITEIVIHKEKILEKIDDFSSTYTNICFSEEQLMDLSFQIISAHTQEKADILNKYGVTYEELIKGVICPNCFASPMLRKGGKWQCSYCGKSSKTEHQEALAQYALLISNYINNREARDFLQLESINITKQLLQKENLDHFGVKSGRKYVLDIEKLM